MVLAERLFREYRQAVDYLVLFDAVARSPTVKKGLVWNSHGVTIPEKVPNSVRTCFHAYRDPRAGSRFFFGNVGLVPESGNVKFEKKPFFGSHGALGGTPYDAKNDEGRAGWDDLAPSSVGKYIPYGINEQFPDTDKLGANLPGLTPDDRDQLPYPRVPVTNLQQDKEATESCALWMWPRLKAAGILRPSADHGAIAPKYEGSLTAGVPVEVR
jgi:hypothetical protein